MPYKVTEDRFTKMIITLLIIGFAAEFVVGLGLLWAIVHFGLPVMKHLIKF